MKDYGIYFIPDDNQGSLKPNDPIVKKDYISKEEVQSLISESESKQANEFESKINSAKSELESKCNDLINKALMSPLSSEEENKNLKNKAKGVK